MGVNKFNVLDLTKANIIEPKEVGYQDSIDIIYDELHKTRKSFIKIGWYLKHINEEEMYVEDGYANIYEFAYDKFHIAQSTATRFMNLCTEFSIGHDSPELDERYLDFSVSQLFEMLPMKQEEKEQVTPDMTVKEIREAKKKSKSIKEPADADINKPEADVVKSEEPENDDNIPGQTSIEKDFPEYMPESSAEAKSLPEKEYVTSHETEEKVQEIIEAEYKEIAASDELEKVSSDLDISERDLRNEIEELAEEVRKVFWNWKPAKKVPYEARTEIEAAKRNAIKLSKAIEKLLDVMK